MISEVSNKNIISRAINHLYPLEITSEASNDKETRAVHPVMIIYMQ